MYKKIGIAAGIAAIVGITFITLSNQTTNEAVVERTDTEALIGSDQMLLEAENVREVVEDEELSIPEANTVAEPTTSGSFEAYDAGKIALAASGDVIIFFHAAWCPSCRALSNDIESNISAIPAGTTILKADYDTETELRKKYEVTTQHTLVQVDQNGNLIKKWSGGSNLQNLLSEIQ